MPLTLILLSIVIGYLLGSVPPGLVLGKLLRGIDIREYGSGKIGATNVQRTLGWGPALLTFGLDIAKGAASVIAARLLIGELASPQAEWAAALAGLGAIAGHNWSLILGGRGGRGMSPGLGAGLALQPWAAALGLALGVLAVFLTDMVSVGSITGTVSGLLLFVAGALLGWVPWPHVVFAIVAAIMVLGSHHDNVRRIVQGRERRLGLRAKLVRRET